MNKDSFLRIFLRNFFLHFTNLTNCINNFGVLEKYSTLSGQSRYIRIVICTVTYVTYKAVPNTLHKV